MKIERPIKLSQCISYFKSFPLHSIHTPNALINNFNEKEKVEKCQVAKGLRTLSPFTEFQIFWHLITLNAHFIRKTFIHKIFLRHQKLFPNNKFISLAPACICCFSLVIFLLFFFWFFTH